MMDARQPAIQSIQKLVASFIERGDTNGLDTSCVARIRRPPFRIEPLELKGITLAEGDLAKLAGRYVEEVGPLEVTYDVEKGKLIASIPGRRFLLVPVTPTRFRVPDDPSAAVTFELERDVEDLRVQSLSMHPSSHAVASRIR